MPAPALSTTGEGRSARSPRPGNRPAGIATLCRRYGKPLWIVTGTCRVPADQLAAIGISRVIELSSSAAPGEDTYGDAPAIIRHAVASALQD